MHRLTTPCHILPIIFFLCFPLFSNAASFDCSKAGNEIERRICANEQISSLDSELATAYKKAISNDPGLKDSQIAWIRERNRCSSDECIVLSYKERIAALTPVEEKKSSSDIGAKLSVDASPAVKEPGDTPAESKPDGQQPKGEQESLAAMAEAKALRDELKQGTEQDEKDQEALIALGVIIAALILGIYWIYRIIIRVKNKGKLALAKSSIKKKYKDLMLINGNEIDESKFSNSHVREINVKPDKILRTEVFFLAIPYAEINTSHACYWSAQKGEVNEGLYSNAMQTYQLARQQYEMARDAAQRAQKPFFQFAPSSPNRSDFITYSPVNGSSSISLKHGVKRLLSEIKLAGRNNTTYTLNLDRFSSVLDKVYGAVLSDILSGKLKVSPDPRVIGFDRLEDHDVLMRVYDACLDALYDDARSSMLYSRDINLGKVSNDISRADAALNIVLTISSLQGDKQIVTLHDYLTPDIVLEKIQVP